MSELYLNVCEANFFMAKDLAAAVIIEFNKILLIENSNDKGGLLGPPGGIVEADEDPPQCIRRELMEELGVRVEPRDFIGVFNTVTCKGSIHRVFMYYTVIEAGTPVNREPSKIKTVSRYTLDQLEALSYARRLVPNLQEALPEIKRYFATTSFSLPPSDTAC